MAVVACGAGSWAHAAGPKRTYQKLSALPLTNVRIADGFWTPRIETCQKVTLPYSFDMCVKTGRIENFVRAAKGQGKFQGTWFNDSNFVRAAKGQGKFQGTWFNDSDVYKIVEGAAYALKTTPDAKLQKTADDVIAKIAAAQQPDGYLFNFFVLGNAAERFKHIARPARHELYTMGHLVEAGAVHYQMTGRRDLLDVACKVADHIDSIFGPGKRMDVPEHQEMELALIKLYEATGQKRYLALGKFFIDQRGNAEGHKLYGAYSQDHKPVRKQSEAVGHAVRAMYNCISMADLYAHTGDAELLAACKRLWQSATHRKMYVTGGVGATGRGEAFSGDYHLPNETAYAETCAQIGLIFFAHRMGLIDPHAEYADVMERALYNAFLSGLSLAGDRFFYQNRLAADGRYRRRPWYGCACCPSNVVRVYPKLGRFAIAHDESNIYVNLYLASTTKVPLKAGPVTLKQQTKYPWDGNIVFVVEPTGQQTFDLNLRIPGWCRDTQTPGGLYTWRKRKRGRKRGTDTSIEAGRLSSEEGVSSIEVSVPLLRPLLRINGKAVEIGKLDKGYCRISRRWTPGDTVELNLPMPISRIRAHAKITADANRVALQRGPIVYCVEAVDHGGTVRHLALDPAAKLKAEHRPKLLGGVTVLTGKASARIAGSDKSKPVDLLAIPYYAWDNRTGGEMAVWLPTTPAHAKPIPRPTIASRAKASASHCNSTDTVGALNDQITPPNSADLTVPRHTWWPHRGTPEWAQYDFAAPTTVSTIEVYWFDDRKRGNCRVPASWCLLARVSGKWQPVADASKYGVELDKLNRVTFTPIKTTALRIEVQLQKDYSGGILEWHVSN